MPFSRHSVVGERKTNPSPLQSNSELPFGLPLSAFGVRPRNPSRWIDRPAQPSPGRLATKKAKRAPPCIVPVSSVLDNIKEKVSSSHPLWLTSPISAIIADVIQKGWRRHGTTLPSLRSGPHAQPRQGRAHERRGSPRRLPHDPLGRPKARRFALLRLPRGYRLQVAARSSNARSVSINSASRPGRFSPATSSRSATTSWRLRSSSTASKAMPRCN